MDTSLSIKSVEQGGRKLQKTITDVNPNADGTALKTWAQGLNALTTNTYVGTTKINIDNLSDEDDSGCNPLPAPKILVGVHTQLVSTTKSTTWYELPVAYGKASLSANVIGGCFYFLTDSTGKVNAVSWPSSALGATRQVKNQWIDRPPTSMTEGMESQNRWQLVCTVPNYDDPECLGKFVFLLDATDTHSSVRITINVISAGE